jgi:hypothetical protein
MLPEGRYRARGTSAAAGVNKYGKDYIAVAFEVIGGEHHGAVVEDVWYLGGEKGAAITVQKLQAAGVTLERGDITDLTGWGEVDCDVTLRLETTPNGQERLRVMYVDEPGAGRGKPLEAGDKAAMRARWASVVAATKKAPRKREDMPF